MHTNTTLGALLYNGRRAKGITQVAVAAHLGLASSDRVSRWENSLMMPSPKNLSRLAALYGLPPNRVLEAMGLWPGERKEMIERMERERIMDAIRYENPIMPSREESSEPSSLL